MNRYQRHVQLVDFGQEAQDKLSGCSVLVVGAGGLGCPVLLQLVAMGVGKIGIVDGDNVEISNLHRQLLYKESDVGRSKVEVACERLKKMNSDIQIEGIYGFVTNQNIFSVFKNFDIIVDGTDQIFTRYLINDACLVLEKPLVYGSVFRYEGHVAVFNVKTGDNRSTNYRDLYPNPEINQGTISCNEAGVLGILPNMIGTFMVNEVIKLITGVGLPLLDKILYYNLKNNQQLIFDTEKKSDHPAITREKVENTDYMVLCSQKKAEDETILKWLQSGSDVMLVDVRESDEEPKISAIQHVNIPLKELENFKKTLEKHPNIVFICQSGSRSKQALEWAKNNLSGVDVYHYAPGVKKLLYFIQDV